MFFKKIAAGFLSLVCIFMLCSCKGEKTSATPDLNKLFTGTASIACGDFTAEATINRLGNGMWDVEFTSPKTLSGVKLSFNGDEITASYLGLKFTVPKDTAPVKGVLRMLFDAVDKTSEKADTVCTQKDGQMILDGEINSEKFKIIFNKETGALSAFEVPDKDLKIEFSSYSEIQ
ncbi:MAG: hypothetical protein JG769_919 [Oscillospiraceae bacterium]|jgi:hypothetical protein|nr:hypothetical protein [Oscillospiraceae bacterium]